MKICGICKIEKDINEFYENKSKNGGRQSKCKSCSKIYNNKNYLENREKFIERANISNSLYKKKFFEWKRDFCLENPCIDCGETDFVVIDFDHVSGIKNFTISYAANTKLMNLNKIIKEVEENCVPRCANCHRRKTAKEKGFHWDVV